MLEEFVQAIQLKRRLVIFLTSLLVKRSSVENAPFLKSGVQVIQDIVGASC